MKNKSTKYTGRPFNNGNNNNNNFNKYSINLNILKMQAEVFFLKCDKKPNIYYFWTCYKNLNVLYTPIGVLDNF